MKQVIEQNTSETITVVTDKDRLSIKQEFKGLIDHPSFNTCKVMILSRDEARRLLPILNQWINGELR